MAEQRAPPVVAPVDPEQILKALAKHRVNFVLIGAAAARLQGFPRSTLDLDITPAAGRENLQRLAAALRDLDARIYTQQIPEGLVFDCSAPMLTRATAWNLITSAGRVDLAFEPSGTTGYDDLARTAVHFTIYGSDVLVASLEDIIRSKEAADRPQDRQDVEVMKEMLKKR